jgi:transcriptional regulator with XRE-family HTH domain
MSRKRFVPRDPEVQRRNAQRIGSRIRGLRLRRGMTQGDVAGDRFTKAYISAMETGGVLPSMTSLHFIAERLNVSPDYFLNTDVHDETVALPAVITTVRFADGRVCAELDDGRSVGLPLGRYPDLRRARVEQIDDWRIVENGQAVGWAELDVTIRLSDFLGTRVLPLPDQEPGPVDGELPRRLRRSRSSSYDTLSAWLRARPEQTIVATFPMIEEALGRKLPPSARLYNNPWYSRTNPLGRAIRAAGFRPHVLLEEERVTLERVAARSGVSA